MNPFGSKSISIVNSPVNMPQHHSDSFTAANLTLCLAGDFQMTNKAAFGPYWEAELRLRFVRFRHPRLAFISVHLLAIDWSWRLKSPALRLRVLPRLPPP